MAKGSNKISALTTLTTLGIAIGTAVLIVVISVMNGFQTVSYTHLTLPTNA